MIKKWAAILLFFMLMFTGANYVFAENQIVEKNDIKVLINGKVGVFSKIPLVVNGRTLLPLRELCVNLGVKNDNAHIIWNGSENSVTIKKDLTNLYLKVGSKYVKINDKTMTIDAEPVNYKGSVYIPARFIAQSFGKVVVWDAVTSSVLIRDEAEYNMIKSILESAYKATNSSKKVKVIKSYDTELNIDGQLLSLRTNSTYDIDRQKKIRYSLSKVSSNSTGDIDIIEGYIKDKIVYYRSLNTLNWEKDTMSEEDYNNSLDFENIVIDILCAGLLIDSNSGRDEILLSGDVSVLYYFMDEINELGVTGQKVKKANFEISINRTSRLVNRVHSEVVGEILAIDNKPKANNVNANYKVVYTEISSEYDGNFEVAEPSDLPN